MEANEKLFALPAWWRFTLVLVATLILCSCQALPPDMSHADPMVGATAPQSENFAADAPSSTTAPITRAPGRVKSTEIRALNGDQVAASRLPNSKEIAAGWSTPVPCHCAACGGGGQVDACNVCPEQAIVGPPDEYLCDGGDYGLPAAVRADWTVDGLDQEDAIAHYDTLDGRVVVTPSNRVCVYAPRFAAVRRVENLLAHERRQLIDVAEDELAPTSSAESQPVVASTQRTAVAINLGERPANLFRGREQAAEYVQLVKLGEFYNTLGPYTNVEIVRSGQLDGSDQPIIKRSVQAAIAWNGDQAAQVVFSNRQAVAVVGLKQPGVIYQTDEPGNPQLRLIKLASTSNALPGEEVEFTLRFDNIGDQTIGNVTIIDNLTTRLEYVPNTAKSTLEAGFSSVPNGTGSTIVRWEIKDALKPGEGGVLQFKCRVR